jgi:hypothetical protein
MVGSPRSVGVTALGGPHAMTVRLGPMPLESTLLCLVTSCGMMLSSVHPYPRECKLLRWLAFPWWRRFESLGAAYCLCIGKARDPLAGPKKPSSPEIRNLPTGGPDAYRHGLPSRASHGIAPSRPGISIYCLDPERFSGPVRRGSLSQGIPFKQVAPPPPS